MVANNISLSGVSPTSPPGVYVSLLFAQGQSGGSEAVYVPLILANMTSQGSAYSGFTAGQVFGPDTLTPLQTVQDAINLFGAGSGAHLMYAALRGKNSSARIYVAPVVAATGTQASQTITISAAGSPTQSTGVVQYQVDSKVPAQAVFGATDSATTIATNLAAAINGNINLPVTASSSGATVTVTAKVPGLRGNDLRGFANVVSGSGVSLTGAANSPANFTSGAGSDAAGYTATLNALATQGNRYYYLVPEAGADNNDGYVNGICAEVQQFVDSQSQPIPGLRCRAVFGSNDTVAHTTYVATSLNDARCEIVQCNKLDLTPGEMAATWVGALMNLETTPLSASGVNFDGFGSDAGSQPYWGVPAPLDGSAPSSSDIQTCLISGVTPLQVTPGRQTKVVKRITTRWFSLGGAGGNTEVLDLRITDAGMVTICDRFFDDLQAAISQTFPRMMIGQDPPAGAPPAPPGVVTVDKVADLCIEIINNYSAANLINGSQTAAGLIVQQNNPPLDSSIGIQVPLFVNSLAHQFLVQGLQV